MSAVARILIGAVVVLAPMATLANAQTPAQTYCTELSRAYGRYVASADFSSWGNRDSIGGDAVAECKEGHPDQSIPILLLKLHDSQVNARSAIATMGGHRL